MIGVINAALVHLMVRGLPDGEADAQQADP
jgi:hypothetical protein